MSVAWTRALRPSSPSGVPADGLLLVSPQEGVVLGDEVLTPDSSRFWDASSYESGQPQASFDKQFVRDWLTGESGWDKSSDAPPPALPAEVVEKTRARYIEAFEKLTGETFPG